MTQADRLIATMRGLLLRHHGTLPLEVREAATQLCTALEDAEAEAARTVGKLELDLLVRTLANVAAVVQSYRDTSPRWDVRYPSEMPRHASPPPGRHTAQTVALPASSVRVRDAFSGTTYLHIREPRKVQR